MGRWVIEQYERVASDLFGQQAANYLMQPGVEPAYIGVLAAILGLLAVKMFWGALNLAGPASEPDWGTLNPNDDAVMRKAYDDLHTVVSLAKLLNENDAPTLEEFREQIRRLGLYR